MGIAPTIEMSITESPDTLDPRTRQFYLDAMHALDEAGVEYLVGGAYALGHHAGVVRHTKDFDVFVRKADCARALDALKSAGYSTERTFPHWLAKAFNPRSEDFVDVIFSSGNGLCDVDDEWFEHAVDGVALDQPARLVAAEEIIWTKAFIQERERFDGADIAHLLRARGRELDWKRLTKRFIGKEQLLLAHLLLFTFIYPAERTNVPMEVIEELMQGVRSQEPTMEKVCQGTLISRSQYLPDLRENGYEDARLKPRGRMSAQDIAHWTAAIGTIR
jgi:hypothetical protein